MSGICADFGSTVQVSIGSTLISLQIFRSLSLAGLRRINTSDNIGLMSKVSNRTHRQTPPCKCAAPAVFVNRVTNPILLGRSYAELFGDVIWIKNNLRTLQRHKIERDPDMREGFASQFIS